jgi:hypothetical protein
MQPKMFCQIDVSLNSLIGFVCVSVVSLILKPHPPYFYIMFYEGVSSIAWVGRSVEHFDVK